MTRLRLGACLSLTGRYGRFGRQAANGLMAWQRLVGDGVAVEIEDDESDPESFRARFARVAARCDLLLGPYSTELLRAAADALDDVDGVLWNQGGAGDDVQALRPGRMVSVLAPTSRYALPFVRILAGADRSVPLWVVRGRGRFGRQVAGGAVDLATVEGLATVTRRIDDGPLFDDVPDVWDLFTCGRYEQDVEIVERARVTERHPRAICSIAAGVREFSSAVDGADGTYGIAQWFRGRAQRPEIGPAEDEFVATYRGLADELPDYPAVQAAAGASIAKHCADMAGGIDAAALWAAATSLETTTLLGEFQIDTTTGAQTKHLPVLLRWLAGELQLA